MVRSSTAYLLLQVGNKRMIGVNLFFQIFKGILYKAALKQYLARIYKALVCSGVDSILLF